MFVLTTSPSTDARSLSSGAPCSSPKCVLLPPASVPSCLYHLPLYYRTIQSTLVIIYLTSISVSRVLYRQGEGGSAITRRASLHVSPEAVTTLGGCLQDDLLAPHQVPPLTTIIFVNIHLFFWYYEDRTELMDTLTY